uniref:Uncharacterized protein n=1 Tax=Ixodes ricinus TaxID=34613 RepID=A0A6B0TVL8_IXORI
MHPLCLFGTTITGSLVIFVFYRRVSVAWRQQGSIIEHTIWQFRSVGGTTTALYSFYCALLALVVTSLLLRFLRCR